MELIVRFQKVNNNNNNKINIYINNEFISFNNLINDYFENFSLLDSFSKFDRTKTIDKSQVFSSLSIQSTKDKATCIIIIACKSRRMRSNYIYIKYLYGSIQFVLTSTLLLPSIPESNTPPRSLREDKR